LENISSGKFFFENVLRSYPADAHGLQIIYSEGVKGIGNFFAESLGGIPKYFADGYKNECDFLEPPVLEIFR